MLVASIPGFGDLIKSLQKELDDTGRIKLCDDTPILVPSPHMVIPYLLQGDESRLMKKAMIYVDQAIRAERWVNDVFKVADIHDEQQHKVRKSVVNDFIKKALPCFNRAGESFDYLVPIDGDAKIGDTWAKTH
jgi:DNA polymerase I-like protein with 3'-5' exonuclease and polymerase domains